MRGIGDATYCATRACRGHRSKSTFPFVWFQSASRCPRGPTVAPAIHMSRRRLKTHPTIHLRITEKNENLRWDVPRFHVITVKDRARTDGVNGSRASQLTHRILPGTILVHGTYKTTTGIARARLCCPCKTRPYKILSGVREIRPMKIDHLNTPHPNFDDLPISEKNASPFTRSAITSGNTWTVKNEARPQADDSRSSIFYGLSSTQTSPAKSRVKRAEAEPMLLAGEPWPDFQERHYRWRLNIPFNQSVDRNLIPEDEGKIPQRSITEALIEGLAGLVLSGPSVGIRSGAPAMGSRTVPVPKLVPSPKPSARPGSPVPPPVSSSAVPSRPSSRPGVPGSRPVVSGSSPATSGASPATPGSRPGAPGSRPGVPSSRPSTPAPRPGIPSPRFQTASVTLPTSADGLQTFAINSGKVSFTGRARGYVYKGIVFRGDTRAPEATFKEGFKLRTKINSIDEINGFRGGFGGGKDALDPDGKGISTSGFYKKDGAGAYYYGGDKGGYTYVIDGDNMEGYHLYQNRHFIEHPNDTATVMQPLEINYGNDIPASNIIGAFDKDGHFVQNPGYHGKFRIPPHQEHHHHYSEHAPQPQPQPIPPSRSEPKLHPQPRPSEQTSHHRHRVPTFGSPWNQSWFGQSFTDTLAP